MFCKKIIITFCLIYNTFVLCSSVYQPENVISYSENNLYKAIASPYFCNEDSCYDAFELTLDSLPYGKDLRTQQLFIYKNQNNDYIKIANIYIPDEYILFSGNHIKISNNGKIIVFSAGIYFTSGTIFKLYNDNSFKTYHYDIFNDFDLSPKETAKVLSDIKQQRNDSTTFAVELKNKYFKISLKYYSELKEAYIEKKKIIYFYPDFISY